MKRRRQVAKNRVSEIILSTVAVALGLAIFAASWNQRLQWLRHVDSQAGRLLQRAWNGGDSQRRVGHVPAFPWKFQDEDDSLYDRLDVGLDGGEL